MCQTSFPVKSSVTLCYYFNVAIFYSSLLLLTYSFNPLGWIRQGGIVSANHIPTTLPPQNHFIYHKNPLALLSGTLKTYQKGACEDTWMNLGCPDSTTISVQFAQYGKTAATPVLCGGDTTTNDLRNQHPYSSANNFTCYSQKAMQAIVSRCQKKAECRFQIKPRTFGGDPCPFAKKFAEVAYKCRPSQFVSIIGCENDVVQLTCNPGSRLAIYSANFGRTEYESVQCPQPNRVQEETCLASHATEEVMQVCHGKRSCSIPVLAKTFGNPCKKESRMYLKVIHTCVPRKVLKKQYQGELETDETEDARDDDGSDETFEHSSSNHYQHPFGSRDWQSPTQETESQGVLNTKAPSTSEDSFARSSAVLNSESDVIQVDEEAHNHTSTKSDIQFINLISQGINAYSFIERNSHTFWLLVTISILSVFLLLLFLLLIRLVYVRHKGSVKERREKEEEEQRIKSSTIRRASGLSDIDELSFIMDPQESYVHLSTIQRRSNPSFNRDAGSGLAKNKVVRYSNSRDPVFGRENSDTSPRSFHQEHESDIHFFFG